MAIVREPTCERIRETGGPTVLDYRDISPGEYLHRVGDRIKGGPGGGGGSSTFAALTDTPAGYGGSAGYLVRVNATPNALEFLDPSTDFLAQYVHVDGTHPLTANWDAGAFQIRTLQFYADGVGAAGGIRFDGTAKMYEGTAATVWVESNMWLPYGSLSIHPFSGPSASYGLQVYSAGTAGQFQGVDAVSAVKNILNLHHTLTAGVAAAGIGVSEAWSAQDDGGTSQAMATITGWWNDVTHASRTASFKWELTVNAATVIGFEFDGVTGTSAINYAFLTGGAAPSYGLGEGVFFFAESTTDPSINPAGGALLWVDGGNFEWRTSGGGLGRFGATVDSLADGNGAGFRAGASSDVHWYRNAGAVYWQTDNNVRIQGSLGINSDTFSYPLIAVVPDASTTGISQSAALAHRLTSGTPAVGFGVSLLYILEDTNNAALTASQTKVVLADATLGHEYADIRIELLQDGSLNRVVTIDSNGDLGVGASNPLGRTHFTDDDVSSGNFYFEESNSAVDINLRFRSNGTNKYIMGYDASPEGFRIWDISAAKNVLHIDFGTGDTVIDGYLWATEAFAGNERSSDPTEPSEGEYVIWMSDGTGKGDDGDVMVASKAGGATKYGTLFDHSGGAAW